MIEQQQQVAFLFERCSGKVWTNLKQVIKETEKFVWVPPVYSNENPIYQMLQNENNNMYRVAVQSEPTWGGSFSKAWKSLSLGVKAANVALTPVQQEEITDICFGST